MFFSTWEMGDMLLVLPALNLSTLNAGILIMNMVDYSMSGDYFC